MMDIMEIGCEEGPVQWQVLVLAVLNLQVCVTNEFLSSKSYLQSAVPTFWCAIWTLYSLYSASWKHLFSYVSIPFPNIRPFQKAATEPVG